MCVGWGEWGRGRAGVGKKKKKSQTLNSDNVLGVKEKREVERVCAAIKKSQIYK